MAYRVAELNTRYFRWEFPKEPFKIEDYIKRKEWVYDTDNCGETTSFWVTSDKDGQKKYYRCNHSWWWNGHGTEEGHVENEFEIKEVGRTELDEEAKKNLRFVV